MLYELRVYEILPGRMKNIVDRFANVTLSLFKKHGIRSVLYLEPIVGTSNQLVYILEWESLADREQRWNIFQSDPEWVAARAASEADGPIVARVINTILREQPAIMGVLRSQR